jgi:hypothetical protein
MIKTLYIASTHYNKVGTIEVDSETKDCVYVDGQRVFKKSGHQFIDKSRKKAVQFLIQTWERVIAYHERSIGEAKVKLEQAKAMLNE